MTYYCTEDLICALLLYTRTKVQNKNYPHIDSVVTVK